MEGKLPPSMKMELESIVKEADAKGRLDYGYFHLRTIDYDKNTVTVSPICLIAQIASRGQDMIFSGNISTYTDPTQRVRDRIGKYLDNEHMIGHGMTIFDGLCRRGTTPLDAAMAVIKWWDGGPKPSVV